MESSLGGHVAYQQQQQQQIYHGRGSLSSQRSHYGQQLPQDYTSMPSHCSRGSYVSSQNSSVVDEAYRRLGQRLSLRAHGDKPTTRPTRQSRIGQTPRSSFHPYDPTDANTEGSDLYSSHSNHVVQNHHKIPNPHGNTLRKMTMNATELFRLWQSDQISTATKGRKNGESPTQQFEKQPQQQERPPHEALSQQRFAFSQLAIDSTGHTQLSTQQSDNSDQSMLHVLNKPDNKLYKKKGLLSAVFENSSQTSSHARDNGSNKSKESTCSRGSSITTKSSIGTRSSINSFRTMPQGKCLTQPSTAVSNEGLDNAEGNLIVYENDTISIPRRQIHVLTREKMRHVTHADFRIQNLLGQGTFAQVFQCLHFQTGNLVAVKVIKNKPAYTRQAAVEIDVFRALMKKQQKAAHYSQSEKVGVSQADTNNATGSASKGSGANSNYMVDLVCYFMYKSHLCLVFELLGLNLYEVLKRRQFRGLPLTVVRTLVKQTVGGVKELAKKSIVHCDLKPENILLVTEDDVDSVVSAGESKRLTSLRGKNKSNLSSSYDKAAAEPPTSTVEVKNKLNGNKTPSKTKSNLNESLDEDQQGGANRSSGLSKMIDPNPVASFGQSPTNSMATARTSSTVGHSLIGQKIKLIDFGSACFEGQTAHSYIQSRFYRSPEVLIGLPYDSAIDMWSLGCVAAELFLGLPILPGVHEHDQLSRICEMIGKLPDWMLDQGSKSSKYFIKDVPRSDGPYVPSRTPPTTTTPAGISGAPSPPLPGPQWRIRTQQEYIASLSQSEIRKKGGLEKIEKQPTNRYFKRKKLADIIMHKGQSGTPEDKETIELFIHFLYGILDPDPWKRLTAHQVAQHPFVTGGPVQRWEDGMASPAESQDRNRANSTGELYWEPPWDPGICRRKLLNVQKMRDLQDTARRGHSGSRIHEWLQTTEGHDGSVVDRGQNIPRNNDFPSRGISAEKRHSPPLRSGTNQWIQEGQRSDQRDLSAKIATPGLTVPIQQRNVFEMSSSLNDYGKRHEVTNRFSEDGASVVSNSQLYPSGPQSYSEAGYRGDAQRSINEVDFVYALQRPGVVPMGEPIASSVDMSEGLNRYHRPQHAMVSHGISHMNQRGVPTRGTSAIGLGSRSFGDNHSDSVAGARRHSIGTAQSLGQYLPHGGQGSFGGQMDYFGNGIPLRNGMIQALGDPLHQMDNPQILQDSMMSGNINQLAYGNAQAYLQQQHAALQQQQALLQQQQAAIAHQQQQLQAYGIDSALVNTNPNVPNFSARNQFVQTGSGYYVVSSMDSSAIMMSNPGVSSDVSQDGISNDYWGSQHQSTGYYQNSFDDGRGTNQALHPPNGIAFRGGMSM